jgi:alpha-glucosidase
VSKYIITARQKGKDWFIAGMNDWDAIDQNINLDFLEDGDYVATICEDGINAEKYAADYLISSRIVNKQSVLKIHNAPGGGFLIRLIKQK